MRPWLISSLTLGADQLTKGLVAAFYIPGQSLPLVPPILHLTYVQNTGAAFGLFKGQHVFFMVLSIIVIGWILWELLIVRPTVRAVIWGCALILGGAVGNLLDRARLGFVVDFIDLRVWPVFNLADSAITIGVCLMIWYLFSSRTRRPSA